MSLIVDNWISIVSYIKTGKSFIYIRPYRITDTGG